MTEVTKMERHEAAVVHGGIAAALARAQSTMGRASKSATNPHFKKAYADLASVMDACMPALTKEGIAVTQPVRREGDDMVLYTILHHGESGETLDDGGMPLLIGKRDMQGLGSAITYARRYGLMAMTGIAPDDDDGNAAVASGPKLADQRQQASGPTPRQEADRLITEINRAKGNKTALTALWDDSKDARAGLPDVLRDEVKAKFAEAAPKAPASAAISDDEIPY